MSEISKKEIEIILARLETQSPELHFSSGDDPKSYSRDEMMNLIKKGDKVGKDFVEMEFEFLRDLRDGTFIKKLASV